MMRAYSIARQNGRTHKRNSSSIPGPSRIIKEESCDTMSNNENTVSPAVPSEGVVCSIEGQSSQQPVIDYQADIASSAASIEGEETVDKSESLTEIQQDDGADLSLDSFQHISPDQPEIAEAIDTSESKGSDEPLQNLSSEVLCSAEPLSSTALPEEFVDTVDANKSSSLSQLELKDDQNITSVDAQPNTQKDIQEQQLVNSKPDTEIVSEADGKAVTINDAPENVSDQQAVDASENEHRQQALRTLTGSHQRAASCMDAHSMFDNSQQSFKQHRKRKMSIRRLSDAFTKSKFPSASEFSTNTSAQEVPQDKRRFSDMLSSPKQTRQLLRKKSSMLLSRIRSSFPTAKKEAQPAC
ncbi:hypothetical protein NQZ79_g6716 [Umbelopsis isabellina]|nr:hypothetical protein NQZ79_g6716 [Umbelopsis isabellina]